MTGQLYRPEDPDWVREHGDDLIPESSKPMHYDTMFEHIRRAWEAHDKTCTSLRHLWQGHPGGVSCPSDLTECTCCGVAFYNEGVTDINWNSEDPDADPDYRCECCRRPGES